MIAEAKPEIRITAKGNQGQGIGRKEKKHHKRRRQRGVYGKQVCVRGDKNQYGTE